MSTTLGLRERFLARVAAATLVFLFALLLGRLFQLQVIQHGFFKRKASALHVKAKTQTGLRGSILDRGGTPLALSTPCRRVVVHTKLVGDVEGTARALAAACDLPFDATLRAVRSKRPYVKLVDRVDRNETIHRLEQLRLEGVEIEETEKRSYPHGSLFSHLLGFVGDDQQGLEGIELAYDSSLVGELGALDYEQDGRQRPFFSVGLPDRVPGAGRSVVLTVDTVIQYFLDREVEEAYRRYQPESVSGVVLNPWDGSILAIANRPNFDPNRFLDAPRDAWRNRALGDSYAPGSTFKPIVASAAFERGLVSADEQIFCENGRWNHEGRVVSDAHSHGMLAFRDVLVKSSNVGMAKVGLRIGRDGMIELLKRFGFGRKTGIDLPGEASGTVTPASRWTEKFTTVSVSFGQEIAVTPLQLATAFATFANGGYAVKPRIVERIVSATGEQIHPIRVEPRRILPLPVAETVRGILEEVVARGTGVPARIAGYRVAGKTGTAERFVGGRRDGYIGSFVAFAPAEEPAIVVLLMLNGVRGAEYYGGTVAAPGVKRVVEDTLLYLGIPPDDVAVGPIAALGEQR